MMRLGGHTAARLDLKYHVPPDGKMNFMDLNSPAGFSLLALFLHSVFAVEVVP